MIPSQAVIVALAIIPSIVLGGYNIASSHTTSLLLAASPAATSVPIFEILYSLNLRRNFLPTASLSFVSLIYLAYDPSGEFNRGDSRKRSRYLVAAALIFGTGLITKFMMSSSVERLLKLGDKPEPLSGGSKDRALEEEVRRLLKVWSTQNYMRVGLAPSAGAVALYASLL